jgi:hypothetical protein
MRVLFTQRRSAPWDDSEEPVKALAVRGYFQSWMSWVWSAAPDEEAETEELIPAMAEEEESEEESEEDMRGCLVGFGWIGAVGGLNGRL